MRKRILTGDRPTGKLHLGHYLGSLKNRLELQNEYEVFIIVADLHALTTNTDTSNIKQNVKDLILDQLAVGVDPNKVTFCLQSAIAEDAELAAIFSMLVTKSRLERIPTLKDVLADLKIENPTLGLLSYPVLMAADILMVRANLVPVGKDQTSHVEITREIAEKFNSTYKEVFPLPEALIPQQGTLPGIDGKAKMSKSLNNAIYLSDSAEDVKRKVSQMYTDPARIHPNDPGKVEGNPVFVYHEAFNVNKKEVDDLKKRYLEGKVGDVEVKEKLAAALNNFLEPIRERRAKFEKQEGLVDEILKAGTEKTRKEAQETLRLVKEAMGLP
ncbi:MAG: tryptophan--tRNA ligase [Candidatus Woykebacteria bacterium RIFCSPHIGHO2_12_FULL_45_10]|uniref:Tryptophan--tRNA ligase n=1 Tax=Candidatus Woykebacteria bacterium RIFCSPHIGHO2_12_FULL_45_10 TaxID=1802603 RepID=A0A1G1WNH2_9BACT|nr:MAG: tryptophan--tRNA ligase [Candidatus Woykebacteria bacterium RIFCSPHIGHO2_12_FULL_45_10]